MADNNATEKTNAEKLPPHVYVDLNEGDRQKMESYFKDRLAERQALGVQLREDHSESRIPKHSLDLDEYGSAIEDDGDDSSSNDGMLDDEDGMMSMSIVDIEHYGR
jgi:hypothetical protein